MKKTVFYSWQSDLPNGTNRTLIENVLKDAIQEIGNEADIEAVIDRDTLGLSGSPNIATAIFQKIDSADIFVADVSIIGNARKRAVPNPNVLIELGYALKVLGHERIILVFNTAFGKVEKLPFDLKMNRTLIYECAESVTDRSEIKKNLTKVFKSALLAGFSHTTPRKITISIVDIIKNNTPSKKIDLRAYLATLFSDLEKIQPPMRRDGGTTEELLQAVPKIKNISIEFAKLAETVVLMNDTDSAKEILQWFGKLLTKYDPIAENGGQLWTSDGDFFKFAGHELFVNFITPFLKEEKWDVLKELLQTKLQVGPTLNQRSERKAPWTELSDFCPSLADEGRAKSRLSLHADLLKQIHEDAEFKDIAPFKDFAETDFFLHLYGEGRTQDKYYGDFYPRSDIWLHHTPRFILDAVDYPTAMKICNTLKIHDTDELKKRLKFLQIRYDWRSPISEDDINKIGSEGGGQVILPSDD